MSSLLPGASTASVKFEASSTMIGFDQGSGARAAKKTAAASAIIGRDGGRERGGRERACASQRGPTSQCNACMQLPSLALIH